MATSNEELQEKYLETNSVSKYETTYTIPLDSQKRSDKSSIANMACCVAVVKPNGTITTEKHIDSNAVATLSEYSLIVEKDQLIGRKISVSGYHGYSYIIRKEGCKYLCSDGKLRSNTAILKQLLTEPKRVITTLPMLQKLAKKLGSKSPYHKLVVKRIIGEFGKGKLVDVSPYQYRNLEDELLKLN